MKRIIAFITLACISFSYAVADDKILPEEPDSVIVAALAMVDEDSLQVNVQALQDMGTRFMIAPNRLEVADWIMDKFLSYGITEVRLDSFRLCHINLLGLDYDTTTWQYNVEARITGTEFPEKEIVLIGHYDDATHFVDPIYAAPGADDNASGTAALIEYARVFNESGYQPRQTVVLLASAAEELMYYGDAGTEHYAAEALAAGMDIVLAVNNDMIGWNDDTWTVQLFNHIGSPQATQLAIDIIDTYTTLNYQSLEPVQDVGGDIQPFLDAGYHGIYFMEHSINPNYHSLGDTIGNLDFAYLAECARIGLGCMLQNDITVNIKDYTANLPTLRIYPNPATSNITICNPANVRPHKISVYGSDGSLRLQQTVSGDRTVINLSGFPDGVYIVRLISAEGTWEGKIVLSS